MIQDDVVAYALRFVGTPYQWGGESADGIDCSGLAQEALASVGADPKGDQTAQALHDAFKNRPCAPQAGALAFYGVAGRVTHVAICIDSWRVLEAGGGGRSTLTRAIAAAQGAFVRIRPLRARGDLVAVLMPPYPSVGE